MLRTLKRIDRERYVPPYAFALVYAGLGQRDSAFQWLEDAYEARDVHLVFLAPDPKWDDLREDPRFRALVERCDFMRRTKPAPELSARGAGTGPRVRAELREAIAGPRQLRSPVSSFSSLGFTQRGRRYCGTMGAQRRACHPGDQR